MYSSTPSTNPRKRAAPGSSSPKAQAQQPQPQQQQHPQQLPASFAPAQMSNDQYLKWGQNGGNTDYLDPTGYNNMTTYGGNGMGGSQYNPQAASGSSTQLARRPGNHHLVSTASRTAYDTSADPWASFGDEQGMDSQSGILEDTDNVELLEERALVAKRDATSKRKQIPPFVQKLSSFLDDGKNTDLIRWSDRGDSFIVLDEDEFAKKLIPELFKHNNYASFVRQLNMYGFHKRVGLSDNSMKASERKNKSPSEYSNPYFRRGHPNLLWLINKPKGGTTQKKGKGGRKPAEDGADGESDDDGRDGAEETYSNNYPQQQPPNNRAISAAPESGPLQKRDMSIVQQQLSDLQKQQTAISNAIIRLRKDNEQLYHQSRAFQTLHDRHESSINAILTFLATVYNRSLDGQGGGPDLAQMFGGGLSQGQQQQGNVVDMGDVKNNQQPRNTGNISPLRRSQHLLMAPPSSSTPQSLSASQSPNMRKQYMNTRPGSIEELFDTTPVNSESPQTKVELDQDPQQMMNLINNTNARAGQQGQHEMTFPDVLQHYETANGNSPLTSEQRSDMLQMMAHSTAAGPNNALMSPKPPQPPNLEHLRLTKEEIEELARLQKDQEVKLNTLQTIIAPLSPSGSIPGLNDEQYFNDQAASGLDLDQFLDSGAYYANNGEHDFSAYDNFDANGLPDASNFDFSLGGDGANEHANHSNPNGGGTSVVANGSGDDDESHGRIIETTGSSEGNSPEDANVTVIKTEDEGLNNGIKDRDTDMDGDGGGGGDVSENPSRKRQRT